MSTAHSNSDTSLVTQTQHPSTELVHGGIPRAAYELTEALGSAEATLVLDKLRDWLVFNRANKPDISFRDGRWWTFRSLKKWCEKEFRWLTPRQLGTIMDKLESLKVITRRQYGASELKMAYWYSVNEDVIAGLLEDIQRANASDIDVESSNTDVKSRNKSVEYKTTEKENKTQNKQRLKPQTTTAPQTDVVVVPPRPTVKEAETGELIIKAEAPQNNDDGAEDQSLVEAPMSQHANDTSLSKVPLKVLSPVAADALRADLIRFGVVPGRITRLIQTYPEADIRHIMDYTRSPEAVNIKNPAGFLIGELEHGGSGVLALRDQEAIKFNQPSPAPDLSADQLDAMRRETARLLAEDAELMITSNQPSPTATDEDQQTLNSIQDLEFAS